jgi:hypothetical protein
MAKPFFRCGVCGNPVDETGACLTIEQIPCGEEADWSKAELRHGECCSHDDEEFWSAPTEDMLRDAGLL